MQIDTPARPRDLLDHSDDVGRHASRLQALKCRAGILERVMQLGWRRETCDEGSLQPA
jgi:hypothetical protein